MIVAIIVGQWYLGFLDNCLCVRIEKGVRESLVGLAGPFMVSWEAWVSRMI